MKKIVLAFVAVAFFLGIWTALSGRTSRFTGSGTLGNSEDVIREESPQEHVPPVVRQQGDSGNPAPPDLRGMAVGTGEVLADVPPSGLDLEGLGEDFSSPPNEREETVWPKTSGKLKQIEDQVREIREDIDETTLDAVSRALNALPYVSAEPEEAEWHISGGEIGLEVTIPVEDIRIGSRKPTND